MRAVGSRMGCGHVGPSDRAGELRLEAGGVERLDELQTRLLVQGGVSEVAAAAAAAAAAVVVVDVAVAAARLLEEGGVGARLLRLLEHHARVVDDGVGLVGPEVSGVSVHSDAGRRLVGCGGRRTGTAR